MKRFLQSVLLAALSLPCFSLPSYATDIPIFPTGPVFVLKGLPWGNGVNAINNNFFFTPLSLSENVCVTVKNLNPTNPHPFTLQISVTADPSSITPSDGTWQSAAFVQTLTAGSFPGVPAGLGSNIAGVAQVSVNVSASSALGGNPDTANVSIIQTTGNCFSGNFSIGTSPGVTAQVSALQAVADSLSQGFFTTATTTNPVANAAILNVEVNNGNRNLYFNRVILTASALVTFNIQQTQAAGTTCTNPSIANLRGNSAVASIALAQTACTVQPGILGNPIPVTVPAGSSVVIDLTGYTVQPSIAFGLEITTGGVTGTVSVSTYWYEK